MRAVSSAVSLTIHVTIVAAAILGTANARPRTTSRPQQVVVVLGPVVRNHERRPIAPTLGPGPLIDVPRIPAPVISTESGSGSGAPVLVPAAGAGPSPANRPYDLNGLYSQEGPEVLSGPLPHYPELLRQAGLEGRVILEATVDTTGRVETASISIISETHPGFVAAARQALIATLFRPARVGGQAVRMRVRVPFEFTLRNGLGPAR